MAEIIIDYLAVFKSVFFGSLANIKEVLAFKEASLLFTDKIEASHDLLVIKCSHEYFKILKEAMSQGNDLLNC